MGYKTRILRSFAHSTMVRTRTPKRKQADIVISELPVSKRVREPYVPPPVAPYATAALPGSSFQRMFPAAFVPLPLHLVRLTPGGPLVLCALGELPRHVEMDTPRPPPTAEEADDEDFCHVFLAPEQPDTPLPVLPSDEDCAYYDRGEDPPRPLYAS